MARRVTPLELVMSPSPRRTGSRTPSQRAGRRVSKREARRVAEYNNMTRARRSPNGFPLRATMPRGRVSEDGYTVPAPRAARRRLAAQRMRASTAYSGNRQATLAAQEQALIAALGAKTAQERKRASLLRWQAGARRRREAGFARRITGGGGGVL